MKLFSKTLARILGKKEEADATQVQVADTNAVFTAVETDELPF